MPISMTQKNGRVSFEFDADTTFVIGEVSRFTGYNVRSLQRLEDDKKIPLSTRDDSGRRVWRAADILKIRDHRALTRERRGRRTAR